MKLKDKVAIVTGASRGIGKAIALEFAKEGASVTVAARTRIEFEQIAGSTEKTAAEIRALGRRALAIKTDVSREESVERMVERTIAEFKRVDILVNNAAFNHPALFKDLSLKDWDRIMGVNLSGPVKCTKAVLPIMIQQKQGHIINLSSVVTKNLKHEPMTGIAYDVSKVAINRLTLGLAEELKCFNIAVNALMPENTETDGWAYLNPGVDMSGWQKPQTWGRYAVFVASQDPSVFSGRILSREDLEKEGAE